MVLDMYDDGGELLKVADWTSPESELLVQALEGAVPVDKSDRNAFPDEEFAYVRKTATGVERYFPIGDSGNLAMSLLYFHQNCEQLDPDTRRAVAGRLAKAASVVPMWKEASAELQKYADSPHESGQAPEERSTTGLRFRGDMFPVYTETQRRAVARALDDLAYTMDPLEKRAVALQCVELGVPLRRNLVKYASGLENPNFRHTVSQRTSYLESKGVTAGVLEQLSDVLVAEDLEKRAELLCNFDAQHGPFLGLQDGVLSVFGPDPFTEAPKLSQGPELSEDQLSKLASVCEPELVQRIVASGFLSLDKEDRTFISDFLNL